ncbi:MAG: endonuclease/exonuclease/phosphatase family protein, partial [Myxococcota bacterium]
MSLRLGTFNVWGLPETFGFGDDVSSRMRLIARRLEASDLDVLLIQEAWTDEVRTTLRAGARAAGFAVADGPGASGGLMTLSRKPILRTGFERFRFRGDPERVATGEFIGGKGFQSTRIEGQHGPVTVVNTHLHARYRRARPLLNSAVRLAQLLQVLRHLSESEGTVVLGGDFNCAAGDIEYDLFQGLSGAFELGGGSRHPTLSKTNYYKRHRTAEDKRIDFLFVRPGSDVAWRARDARLLFAETARIREIDRSLSDHFGFRAELALTPLVHPVAFSSASPPDPTAILRARRLLDVGDAEAERRQRVHSEQSVGYAAAAMVALGARRAPAVSRRRLLRGLLGGAACAAIVPAS